MAGLCQGLPRDSVARGIRASWNFLPLQPGSRDNRTLLDCSLPSTPIVGALYSLVSPGELPRLSELRPFPLDFLQSPLVMDFDNLKNQVSNLTLYDLKAGVRKVQNGTSCLSQ